MGYWYPKDINVQIMDDRSRSSLRSSTDFMVTPNVKNYIKPESLVNVTSEWDKQYVSRSERQLDLNVAASGYSHEYYCPEGIPVETALFALLAASALAFGILFMAITAITGGRKKREATTYDYGINGRSINYSVMLTSLLWQGMS